MLRRDAEHRGAKAAGVVQGDDLLVFRSKFLTHAIHEMNFCSHREHRAGPGLLDDLQQALGGADAISFLANFPAAFGMDNDLNARIFGADVVDMFRKESLVNRAVALPENDSGILQPLRTESAIDHVGIPNDHFVKRDSQVVTGVASQMLIGQEEDFGIFSEGPT